jgi:hypothetical protein
MSFDRCAISPSFHPPLAAVRLNADNSRICGSGNTITQLKFKFKEQKEKPLE